MGEASLKNAPHRVQPSFCQYAGGGCDQSFSAISPVRGVLLYASEPPQIAATIEAAAKKLTTPTSRWKTWRDFNVAGQILFCAICKNMRFADVVVADVTTLNFNVLFEIGIALGLDIPLIPIRDTTYSRDRQQFDDLGMLDTLGYIDFQNSDALAAGITDRLNNHDAMTSPPTQPNRSAPLYVVKSPIHSEGESRFSSTLNSGPLRFRAYDPQETRRLPLQEARRQVLASFGVIAHLLDLSRTGAAVHNARCALIAGMAVAAEKSVLLIQEGVTASPLDYRDIVRAYKKPDEIPRLVDPFKNTVIGSLQDSNAGVLTTPKNMLEGLDIGDGAAENESYQLKNYFVRTAQFLEAKRGHTRLVIGRKGSGKTAIFYALHDTYSAQVSSHVVIDIKPDGYQFLTLREAILSHLPAGLQEYLLTAFWMYILLCEIARRIIDNDRSRAKNSADLLLRFEKLEAIYKQCDPEAEADFSERLRNQIKRMTENFGLIAGAPTQQQLTEKLFQDSIRQLNEAVCTYLEKRKETWLLIDNLDKGWPTCGASKEDIDVLRTLLEATRKMQNDFQRRTRGLHAVVFLRNDIYDLLVRQTADRGKESTVSLDWDDPIWFQELIRQRFATAEPSLNGTFDEVWATVFDQFVHGQDSYHYMISRTLMRPRDLLAFVRRAIDVAVNRRHKKVLADDIAHAEAKYSEDMFKLIGLELKDIRPTLHDVLYAFVDCPIDMPADKLNEILRGHGVADSDLAETIRLLIWFGVLGVDRRDGAPPVYSYQAQYDVERVMVPLKNGGHLVVHPALRSALNCK